MLALKEFANFIFLNLANLATTYDRLLAENDEAYKTLPADTRIASARRLIKAVAEACEAGTPDPFRQHFDNPHKAAHLPGDPKPAQPLLEIECLSQTLTPVVTNLEAGKFLWHMLSEARATTLHSLANGSVVLLLRPAAPATRKEMRIPRPEEDQLPSSRAVVSKIEEPSPSVSPPPPEQGADRHTAEQAIQIQNKIILDLAGSEKLYESDLSTSLEEITRATAQALEVQRVSIWFYNQDRSAIHCAKLYELNENRYSDGVELEAKVYPAYFEALTTQQIIAAHEAHTHPHTREFSKDYLTPLGISSLLDVPIQREGRMMGVVCHEHIGPVRQWTAQEQAFALSMAGLVSRVLSTYEHREAEEQLRKLSRAVEQSANSIVITDTAGYIQYVNRKFTETSGYSPEEAIGKHTRILKSGFTPAEEYRRLWKTIISGGEWQGEFCNRKKNRETYWEFASISPIKDEQGVITHFLAVKEDITERKQVEGALEQERKLLRTLIDNFPDTNIFFKDTESRFVTTNATHLLVLGKKNLEEVIGKTDFDFFPQELAAQYYADEQAVIKSGQPLLNRVEPVSDQAGKMRWYLTNKIPLQDEQGRVTGLIGLSVDITERKQLEQQIEESLTRRSRQLQLSTQLALDIATSTDLTGLSHRVVTQINKQLDYYHTQFLLVDEATNTLLPIADYGQSGQQILADREPISLVYGLISRAAALGTAVLRANVSTGPHWRPHLLLPDIKGELAVPIKSGEMDVQTQAAALNHFISGGLDGFVVFAIESSVIAPIAKAALEHGLKVVAKGNDLGEANQTAGIMTDEYKVGYLLGEQAGEWAKTHLPAGKTLKVGVFNYRVLPQVVQREEGIIAGIRAVFGDNLEIVGNETAADPVVALPIAEEWLKQHIDLDMIVAINDAAALGAYRAVIAAGRDDSNTFFVGGVDGVEEALTAIKLGGAFQATVDNSPVVMGITALRTLVAAIVGRPYERAPMIKEAPINRSNIDEFWGVERRLPPDENLAGLDLSGLKIGLSVMTLTNPYFAALVQAVQQEAERLGIELFINDPVEVLGILDVRSNVAGALNIEDQLVLEGLCAQLTMAITNQRLEARRRQAEARLVDERNLMRTLIDNLPDTVYVKDRTGRFLLVNKAQTQLMGLTTPEDLIGKSDFDFYPAELAHQYYADEEALLASGQPLIRHEEVNMNQQTGERIWTATTKVPLRDERGEIIGLVGISSDISHRKQIEETLAKTLSETEHRAHREQTIREITEKMRAATSLQDLVKTTARELGQRLSAEHAVVELGIETDTTS